MKHHEKPKSRSPEVSDEAGEHKRGKVVKTNRTDQTKALKRSTDPVLI